MNNTNIAIEKYLNNLKRQYNIKYVVDVDGTLKIIILQTVKNVKIDFCYFEKKIIYMIIEIFDIAGDCTWRRLIQGKYFNNLSGAFKIIELIVSLVIEEEG